MSRRSITWLGPFALAGLIFIGSVYLRFNSADLSAESPDDTSPPAEREITAEPPLDEQAPAVSTLPERLPAVEDLSEWSRIPNREDPSWRLRWESNAHRAARVLAYLSSNSHVMDFSLTAGPGDEWIIEASVAGGDDGTSDQMPDREGEAELARLLHGSSPNTRNTAEVEDAADPEGPAGGPVHDILSGGSGSVRFRQGDTYRWVRRHDVLSLELSP